MKDKERALFEMVQGHAMRMSERDRLAYLVRMLWRSDYGWGKEIVGDTDCSGSVCFALYCMGYNIRVTAHDILNMLCNEVHEDSVKRPGDLVFFRESMSEKIKHVAVFSDNDVIMNASSKFEDLPLIEEVESRRRKGQPLMQVGRIDWMSVAEVSKNGNHAYGVDTELKPLFGVFGE